mmetsp:Transcript_869/g.3210  ORF Transcript_869/g.3210 Transcript_869/m.3210 type:complete len:615 (+) Transcript_869:113-1957(+)
MTDASVVAEELVCFDRLFVSESDVVPLPCAHDDEALAFVDSARVARGDEELLPAVVGTVLGPRRERLVLVHRELEPEADGVKLSVRGGGDWYADIVGGRGAEAARCLGGGKVKVEASERGGEAPVRDAPELHGMRVKDGCVHVSHVYLSSFPAHVSARRHLERLRHHRRARGDDFRARREEVHPSVLDRVEDAFAQEARVEGFGDEQIRTRGNVDADAHARAHLFNDCDRVRKAVERRNLARFSRHRRDHLAPVNPLCPCSSRHHRQQPRTSPDVEHEMIVVSATLLVALARTFDGSLVRAVAGLVENHLKVVAQDVGGGGGGGRGSSRCECSTRGLGRKELKSQLRSVVRRPQPNLRAHVHGGRRGQVLERLLHSRLPLALGRSRVANALSSLPSKVEAVPKTNGVEVARRHHWHGPNLRRTPGADASCVPLEIQCEPRHLDRFAQAPRRARIDARGPITREGTRRAEPIKGREVEARNGARRSLERCAKERRAPRKDGGVARGELALAHHAQRPRNPIREQPFREALRDHNVRRNVLLLLLLEEGELHGLKTRVQNREQWIVSAKVSLCAQPSGVRKHRRLLDNHDAGTQRASLESWDHRTGAQNKHERRER